MRRLILAALAASAAVTASASLTQAQVVRPGTPPVGSTYPYVPPPYVPPPAPRSNLATPPPPPTRPGEGDAATRLQGGSQRRLPAPSMSQ